MFIKYLYNRINEPLPEVAQFMKMYIEAFGVEIWPINT